MIFPDPTPFVGPAYQLLNALRKAGAANRVAERVSRTLDWVRSGETQVAVFGAGGTGKTKLVQYLLTGDINALSSEYKLSWELKRAKVPGGISAVFLDVPGQKDYVDTEWVDAFEYLSEARSLFAINVVGYGFHQFNQYSIKERVEYEDGMSYEAFCSAYQELRLADEVDRLKSLLNGLAEVKKPIRLITLINKRDLWWENMSDVRQYYEANYETLIEAFRNSKSASGQRFRHEYLTGSLFHQNFVSSAGEFLHPVSRGYDLGTHLSSLLNISDRFSDTLENASKRS